MQVINDVTQQMIGHLTDISPRGFKLDSPQPIPSGQDFRMRMDLAGDIADKSYMVFVARSKWCRADELDPFLYNVGFEIVSISPVDAEIFARLFERYGAKDRGW
jgi:hypothetical protein